MFRLPPKRFIVITLRHSRGAVIGIVAVLILLTALIIFEPNVIPTQAELTGYTIAIDPGHGGRDSGSAHAGVYEKEITLLLSQAIAKEIQARGGTAVLTRTSDTDLWDYISYEEEIEITKREYKQDLELGRTIDSRDRGIALGTRFPPTYRLGLRARLLIAQQHNADLLLSIHTNHYRAESAKGAVTLYQPHSHESQQLAVAIQRYLKDLLPGRADPGIKPDNFFILRRSEIPAVLLEIGFVSNKGDREFMLSEEGQKAIAEAVVNGIEDYFSYISTLASY